MTWSPKIAVALSLLAAPTLATNFTRHGVARQLMTTSPGASEAKAPVSLALGVVAFGGGLAMTGATPNDNAGFSPAPVVPLASEPPARIIVDSPHPGQLALGRVVVRYRTENLRIAPVYGLAARGVSPRLGHLHITVDDAPWHWLDASGEPIVLNGFSHGPHKLLVELADPTHKVIDSQTVKFEIP